MLAASEGSGPGLLTHPTLGLVKVVCEMMSIGEALDGASFSSIEFSFVEAGQQGLPSLFVSSFGVPAAVLAAVGAAAAVVRLASLNGEGAAGSANGGLPAATVQWSGQVVTLGNDATALSRLTAALPGSFGRYSRGATSGFLSRIDAATSDTVPQLVTLAAGQRAAIADAVADLQAVVQALTVAASEVDYADAAARVVAALAAACADPADALRLLAQLLAFTPSGLAAVTPIGVAVADLITRLIVLEIVRAAAAYQPASYEDAFARLVAVVGVIDDAILVAGDRGQDDLFAALRALRVEVVTDLRGRGASLTHVRTFTTAAPIPAIVLAQQLYRNTARADELVGEAGAECISPLFMPTSIQALAA